MGSTLVCWVYQKLCWIRAAAVVVVMRPYLITGGPVDLGTSPLMKGLPCTSYDLRDWNNNIITQFVISGPPKTPRNHAKILQLLFTHFSKETKEKLCKTCNIINKGMNNLSQVHHLPTLLSLFTHHKQVLAIFQACRTVHA